MIHLSIADEVARITMVPDVGERFTILNTRTIRALIDTLRSLECEPVKVVRIFGTGGSFAVGANIKTMHGYSGFTAKGFSILGNRLFNTMREMPQTIIAEIDGYCMGGGADFASSADIRFATNASKFMHPGGKLGIITGFGGTQKIPRLMRPAQAQEVMLYGDVFDAEYMEKGGFIHQRFATADAMHAAVDALCAKMVKRNKIFLGTLKKLSHGQHTV